MPESDAMRAGRHALGLVSGKLKELAGTALRASRLQAEGKLRQEQVAADRQAQALDKDADVRRAQADVRQRAAEVAAERAELAAELQEEAEHRMIAEHRKATADAANTERQAERLRKHADDLDRP